jgi:predicted glycoside hydrolase/deacetylase ChbG (UPF0249 family)
MVIKRLIVNADDYGHTSGISSGIRQAHLNGIVTSTTTMMNRPYVAEALSIAQKECPRLGLGLHLVLTSGTPLLPPEQIRSLVDEEGRFCKQPVFFARMEALSIEEVEKEWRAQIQAFVSASGRKPDHLDSHHHSSYYTPTLFQLMLELARELNCPIRLPLGVEETLFARQDTHTLLEKSRVRHPQVFLGGFYDESATLGYLREMLTRITAENRFESFELMCHPGLVDAELRQISVYNDQRNVELELLTNPEIKRSLAEQGIRLIRFSDL